MRRGETSSWDKTKPPQLKARIVTFFDACYCLLHRALLPKQARQYHLQLARLSPIPSWVTELQKLQMVRPGKTW